MSGGGTMEPIGGDSGPPVASLYPTYKPPVRTILPLARYAEIMGINPIQFMSGVSASNFPSTGGMDRWVQYSWQDDAKVSREELALEIKRAEQDIAAELRFWPGPVWIEDDIVEYPQFYRKGYVGLFGHGSDRKMKSVKLTYGKFISGGKRSLTYLNTPTVALGGLVYSDEDGDGFNETATITVATSLTDPCKIKIYHAGEDGDQEWEIRPLKTKIISGGYFVATVDSWLLFNPTLLAALPGTLPSGFQAIDAEDSSNYVTSVDVYHEDTDPSEQCYLLWPGSESCSCGGVGCSVCGFVEQTACLTPQDSLLGLTQVVPATYDAVEETWTSKTFSQGYEPARVKASYLSGLQERDRGTGCYVMPHDIAIAVSYMVTARLSRPLCTKSQVLQEKESKLKEDLIMINPTGETTRFVTREIMSCPFGTRYGEVEAWRIVKSRKKTGEMNTDVALV